VLPFNRLEGFAGGPRGTSFFLGGVVVCFFSAPLGGLPIQVRQMRRKAALESIEEKLNGRMGPQLS